MPTTRSSSKTTSASPPTSLRSPTPSTVTTRAGVPITIDLNSLASDPQGDLIGFTLSNPQEGTVELSLDGHTATFTPAAGFSGTASFTFTADDASSESTPATVTVNVQNSNLQDISFNTQNVQLVSGQTAVLGITGT